MKKISLSLLVLLLLISSVVNAENDSKKWGLIIGIGKYPEAAGVENFICTDNDVDGIQKMFTEKWSVPSENIVILKNEQGTQENIKKAIADMSAKVNDNDYLFIYVRARGDDAFPDFKGNKKSGYAQTIVPYDCQWKYPKTYITDDKTSQWLKDVKGKIVAIFDVNSGSGLINFYGNKELEARTLVIGPSIETEALEDESSQHGLMTHFLLDSIDELYDDYLKEIKNNSEEAQNLTLAVILEKVKKKVDVYFEDRTRTGGFSTNGRLDSKSIIILKK
jgi:hypothetical protein